MFEFPVSPDILTVIASAILAILFDWFPKLAPWYDKLSVVKKRQLMFGLIVASTLAIYGGGCVGLFVQACDKNTLAEMIFIALVAISVNQGMHLVIKPVKK